MYVDGQWYWQFYAECDTNELKSDTSHDTSKSSDLQADSSDSVAAWPGYMSIGFSVGETNGVMYRYLIEGGFAFEAGLGWSIIGEDAVQIHAALLLDGDWFYAGVGPRVKFQDNIHYGLRFPLGLQHDLPWRHRPQVFLEAAPLLDVSPHTTVHLSVSAGMRW